MIKTIFNFQFFHLRRSFHRRCCFGGQVGGQAIFKKKKSAGFTLIETIMYLGILSILIVSMFELFTSILDVQLESESASSVSQDARYILNRFTYDVGRAKNISVPTLGSQYQILTVSDGPNTYTYYLSGGNLMILATPAGTLDQLNSVNSTVSDLSFLRLADINSKNDTASINFTLTSKFLRKKGQDFGTFKTTVGIR